MPPAASPCPARTRRPARLLVTTALALCTTAGTVAASSLRPASADVAADIVASQSQLDSLNHEAEAAAERYNKGRIDLEAAQLRVQVAKVRLAQQDAQVADLRTQAGAFAVQSYRSVGGGAARQLAIWTRPGSAQDILSGLASLDAVAQKQSDVLAQLATARARQRSTTDTAQAAADAAAKTLDGLDADRRAVIDAATRGQQVLADLQAKQTQLAQVAKDAAARQAAQQAAADLASQARGAAASLNGFRSQGTVPGTPVAPSGTYPGSQAAQVAVRTALAQLGKPYVFGAAGPNSFDCSGLTMYAYRAAGISLPHFTGAQIGAGRRVGYADLQPGDLLFFPGHEGMYIGNGQMVHAPHTGTVVQIVALAGYYQSQFIGATRVAG